MSLIELVQLSREEHRVDFVMKGRWKQYEHSRVDPKRGHHIYLVDPIDSCYIVLEGL